MNNLIEKIVERLTKCAKECEAYYEKYGTEDDFGGMNAYEHAISVIQEEAKAYNEEVCEWRLCDEEANVYDTTCRNHHILIEGSPIDNNYEFCPYCGKKIKVVE